MKMTLVRIKVSNDINSAILGIIILENSTQKLKQNEV
jgi:hypothetical protein